MLFYINCFTIFKTLKSKVKQNILISLSHFLSDSLGRELLMWALSVTAKLEIHVLLSGPCLPSPFRFFKCKKVMAEFFLVWMYYWDLEICMQKRDSEKDCSIYIGEVRWEVVRTAGKKERTDRKEKVKCSEG